MKRSNQILGGRKKEFERLSILRIEMIRKLFDMFFVGIRPVTNEDAQTVRYLCDQ